MTQQTLDLHVNPSDETIRVGLLTVRFLLTADNSSGSIAAFEVTVPGGQRLLAPAHSHDHYEETIYGIDGVLTWTVDGRQIEVGPGQALCIPLMFSPWIFISFQVLVKDPISGSVVVCVQCRGRQDHLWSVSALDRYPVELWENLDREQRTLGRPHPIGAKQHVLSVGCEAGRHSVR